MELEIIELKAQLSERDKTIKELEGQLQDAKISIANWVLKSSGTGKSSVH